MARGTAAFLGMPMRAWEQREWEYRSEYIAQFPEALDPWVSQLAQDTYAGYYVDDEHGGTIYIGFVGDQEAQLAAFLASSELIAPERLKPFPSPPGFSMAQLFALQSEIGQIAFRAREPGWKSINRILIDTPGNVVEVVTERVNTVQRLIDERFGSAAPIVVVYGPPLDRKVAGRIPKR